MSSGRSENGVRDHDNNFESAAVRMEAIISPSRQLFLIISFCRQTQLNSLMSTQTPFFLVGCPNCLLTEVHIFLNRT